ncbi:MAG: linear amide C-N hydrolase [Rickettsiales endosymbiont of Dermacentor nuttalli]
MAPPTLHFLITDRTCASAVIESINGEMKIFTENDKILANPPTYDWHNINIRNYLNLSNFPNQCPNLP